MREALNQPKTCYNTTHMAPTPHKTRFWSRFFKKRYIISAIVILVVIGIIMASRSRSKPVIETAAVVRGDVVEKVSVTGKISATEKAELAFEKGGVLTRVYVKVGDQVSRGTLIASLDTADTAASLASAQAKLDDMTRKLRPEELQVEKARVDTASAARSNAEADMMNALRDGYVKAQGAVVNSADILFTNPQSANPTIKVPTQAASIEMAINTARVSVTDVLNSWKGDLITATSSIGIDTIVSRSHRYVNTLKSFMDGLSSIVNYLNPSNSGLSQTTINTYVSNVTTAQAGLNQAINSITAAETALIQTRSNYDEATSNFTLKNAGSSNESIRSQQATVASLAATVAKGRIISPIDGIITKAEPKEGEFVAPGQSVFAVMSAGIYKIEAYIPEADIAKVSLGNHASVTLDAYGSDTFFPATVSMIDPAETIIEGVPTYKTTLMFDEKDARIRSGMTANTYILTRQSNAVLQVPTRAIIDNNGVKSVRVLRADGSTFDSVLVKIGLKGSDGTTEILSGVNEGDKVVTYTK